LVAKVDPGNVASLKIIKRAGALKGGLLKGWYTRPADNGIMRDIEFWWINRPGVSEEKMVTWKEEIERQMLKKNVMEKEKEKEKEKEEREKAEVVKVDNEKIEDS